MLNVEEVIEICVINSRADLGGNRAFHASARAVWFPFLFDVSFSSFFLVIKMNNSRDFRIYNRF